VEVLGLVLEDLDALHHAPVADVARAVELQHPRVALAVAVELGDVLIVTVGALGADREDHYDRGDSQQC